MAELHPKSHPPTSPMSSDSSVRSVERAIDVLFSFTQQEPVLDIPALQQRGPFDFSAESDGSCLPAERGLARGLLQGRA